ncbi:MULTISPECIES: LptA/OstA family protein [unclassified Coleofasciculus]|uniref:LptA/OstA family protein n=1 Tax=unclassified Coleofasciculus TaxID=2692782 RepID=UPI00187EB54E|nr:MULTISPECIES: LptA/OstA family protein [unclassified Coleofasciculus]MBE9128099.1 organic solvent tolerance protein OstA [Coleofasciculus sp. LEGE 07081]MBE9146972.1 organic solvent tolerance protein OstA [Coleofasciculus sp. LEGE 07092]
MTTNLKQGLGLVLMLPITLLGAIATPAYLQNAQAQTGDGRAITVRADVQEANSLTGVVTARGNVQIDYPARQIQATAAQAQYFSKERRIILSGNVYVLQQGNSLRGETITYLIDEGRFIALPEDQGQQVESIYIVSDPEAPTQPVAPPVTPPFNPKPAFKTPVSDPASGQ